MDKSMPASHARFLPARRDSHTHSGMPAAPLMKYAERLFARPAFSEALTSAERGMRK